MAETLNSQTVAVIRRTEAGTAICRDDAGRHVVVNEVAPDWAKVRRRHDRAVEKIMKRRPGSADGKRR